MSKYQINHDFKKYQYVKIPYSKVTFPIINGFLKLSEKTFCIPDHIKKTSYTIKGLRKKTFSITIFEPDNQEKTLPCLLYLHGGGFSMRASRHHFRLMCEYALKTPCKVVFIDYHLVPKYPYPHALEETYETLKWVYENSFELGILRDKIAVGGDSAGGALAAALTHYVRDKAYPSLCFQMLIYPVTDMRQQTESMGRFKDTPIWDSNLNQKMWSYYLANGFDKSQIAYISPSQSEVFEFLPSAYIEVAEFDCLRDEGINYAKTLEKNGIFVTLNQTKGTIHGYDSVDKSELVKAAIEQRIQALQYAFYQQKRMD